MKIQKNKVYQQNREFIDEHSKLRLQISSLLREKELANENILNLESDIKSQKNRMSQIQTEQRDLRNRWLEEKTDLESKVHQMLAVQTQVQGSLRKKEKEYDNLQQQLSKIVKGN